MTEALRSGAGARIHVRDVHRSFGARHVLQGVSLEVQDGQIVGLLGPSGAGKTTLVRLIAGTDVASRGTVTVAGTAMPALSALDGIGYMAQSDALYLEISARANMSFFGSLYGLGGATLADRIRETAALVDLVAHLDRPVMQYSGGMKRRLSLAISLLHRPSVLILDEPTVGIDPALRVQIWGRLREYAQDGASILVTTHVMDEAERCDVVCMLRDGHILAADSPAGLKDRTGCQTMEEAFLHFGGAA